MCSCKFSALAIALLVGYASAAPFLEDVGRTLHDIGQKAIPAVRGVCGFVNAYRGYPQQGYPQGFQGYPVVYPQGRAGGYPPSYPQFPGNYPQFPGYYPQFSGNFPQNPNIPALTPGTNQKPLEGDASEQDDLNKVNLSNGFNVPPPQIQDIFKNFDNLPKVDLNRANVIQDEDRILKHRPKIHHE